MPDSSMHPLTLAIGTSRRWKMPAARPADAPVRSNTSTKCSGLPAPLLAMTGMVTASVTMLMSSVSNPAPVPSRSMQLSRISPAPRASTARATSYAPMSRPSRPPFTVHWNQQYSSPLGPGVAVRMVALRVASGPATYTRRGSMLTTTAWAP